MIEYLNELESQVNKYLALRGKLEVIGTTEQRLKCVLALGQLAGKIVETTKRKELSESQRHELVLLLSRVLDRGQWFS